MSISKEYKMRELKFWKILICCLGFLVHVNGQQLDAEEKLYRPAFHFTPPSNWMNDPNGMFFLNGTYHLYYQHNPFASVWGPMHWGHATSKDLVHWEHQPIALFPDRLGTIFSGSIVVDHNNTSGFGQNGKVPVVAIYTQHDQEGADKGKIDFQTQGIAYSLDEGYTWTKYESNPVLKNPGIRDFRDPKVFWHKESKKWIMTLAVLDRIHFYSSDNLIAWEKLSEFGDKAGAHGGVWECPDLFPLEYKGKQEWVLLVNMNPGGPNKGSATQYFVGNFNGKTFSPNSPNTKWVDYGPDEYAGVTFSNTKNQTIFLGWMSNWNYANTVPTQKWRSACTFPRKLSLYKQDEEYLLASSPFFVNPKTFSKTGDEQPKVIPHYITLNHLDSEKDFSITLSNNSNEKLVINYVAKLKEFQIDRSKSGIINFDKGFSEIIKAPRFSKSKWMDLKLVIDKTSVEVFADIGLTVMTAIYFPTELYNTIQYQLPEGSSMRTYALN